MADLWCIFGAAMAYESVRFGVELDRKTDARFKEIASVERRSKRSMHALMMLRIVKLWEEKPQVLEELGLVKRAH